MPTAPMLLLTAAAAYAGFQWTVHVVVYRQFSAVPPSAFGAYERLHQRRISYVVGPLFVALIAAAGWLLISPLSLPIGVAVLPAVVVAAILLLTGLLAVPLHRRLSAGWDAGAYRSLLLVDLSRTVLASVNVVLAMTLVLLAS